MCLMFRQKNRSCWKELDENIIYYQSDTSCNRYKSHLTFMNVSTDKTMEYFHISQKSLGLLNTHNSYLNVFIETQSSTIIAKLYKDSLNLKVTHNIFQEYLFFQGPIYDFNHHILLILQNRRFVQLSRNKLIRKYKGDLEESINYDVIELMGLRSFNLFRKLSSFFFDKVQQSFERIFNISIQEINEKYGYHIFKKIGNFIILKKKYKYQDFTYQKTVGELPVYFMSIVVLLKGDGATGRICLGEGSTPKLIKQFDKNVYTVVKTQKSYSVYEIRNEQLILVQQVHMLNNLKKPILQLSSLIATDRMNCVSLQIIQIDLKKVFDGNIDHQEQ